MPKITRSPPRTPTLDTEKHVQFSTPTEEESVNITTRTKRLQPQPSPATEWNAFENKITNLLSNWKKDQDIVMEKLTSEITEIKRQNAEIQKANAETLKTIEFLSNDYDCLKKSLQKIENENVEQRNYITQLENKITDLQRYTRSSCIEIRNVPASEKETNSHLTTIVLKTCSTLQPSHKTPQLRDVYRLPGKKGSNRPIVAEFLTVTEKNQILEASRTFNKGLPPAEKLNTGHIGIAGELKPVYVADYLPVSQRQLFYETRVFAKTNKYNFCWCQNGKIFLRKREGENSILINSKHCLNRLLATPC